MEFETIEHEVDLCVVGGGIAGLIAAVSAARHGAKVLLMNNRPVLGGNASSEVRMWICGARGAENKETGLLEEIMLDNYYYNADLKYPVWDHVLYGKARYQDNLELMLNTAATEVMMDGSRIAAVKAWQLTSQTWHVVRAKYFADCSGDSVLRVSGAEFRWGRESRHEFNESLAPEVADRKTMGNSILMQMREVDEHRPFIPPPWAYKFKEEDLPNRFLTATGENFWWLEVGGTEDTIRDSEKLRDELLKIAFGVWDLIKNHPDGRARGWELEWIGALPGKRENVRYIGDHTLTQNDVLALGKFEDMVGFGGWPMDDHPPQGLYYKGPPTVFHASPSPYGIPYRCLYSRNIENLFFAGRNLSATHMAMSSTRVMATCSTLGQAVGTAAALCARYGCSPREIYQHHILELQTLLLDDDCYLPWHKREIPELTLRAELSATRGDPDPLRDGVDRDLEGEDHGWWGVPAAAGEGDCVEYRFGEMTRLSRARLVFDSSLADRKRMPCSYPKDGNRVRLPEMLVRDFALEIQTAGGQWVTAAQVENNFQRLVKVPLEVEAQAVRFKPLSAWGGERVHVFGFEVR